MKRTVLLITILVSILSCKTDKDKSTEINKSINFSEQNSKSTFEDSLLDVREVNKKFNDYYKVEKFGIQKQGDSLIGFVFKLNDSTTKETIEAYSLSLKMYDRTLKEPIAITFNPFLEEIDGHKYVRGSRVITETKYFDSIYAFIYKRKDWKGSGSLGSITITDILIEDKK